MKRLLSFIAVASGTVTLLGSTAAVHAQTTTQLQRVVTYESVRPVIAVHLTAAASQTYYRVRSGDTLSSIAQRTWHSAGDWPALWWSNRHEDPNPNSIGVGQELVVPASASVSAVVYRKATERAQPRPIHVVVVHHYRCGDGDGDGFDMPCWKLYGSAPTPPQPAYVATSPATVSYSGGSAFQQCVMQAESGGNPQAVNPYSGAAGLYGFLPSTWHALGFGGLPQDASVATQNAAFAAEYARSGTSPWAPYDGC